MILNRRGLIAGALAGAGMAAVFGVAPARALNADQAKAVVQATIDDLVVLLRQPGDRAAELRRIMEARANIAQIARFSAGRVWREMSPEQQHRFVDAFSHYVSVTYARRFDEYAGGTPDITVGRAVDAGNKGFLVQSPIAQGRGQPPIAVDWLVSDRGGKPEIVDLIIEGVSMATTQREEIGAKFQSRGQDVETLINDLAAAS